MIKILKLYLNNYIIIIYIIYNIYIYIMFKKPDSYKNINSSQIKIISHKNNIK